MTEKIKASIRDIPDFPKKGILYKDITTLCKDAVSFKRTVDIMADRYKDEKIDYVVGIEARGFVVGSALAYTLGAGIVLVRKEGKLPHHTHKESYELEYGEDILEIHKDAIEEASNVIIVDDLLATGGTAGAVCSLVKKCKGNIHELCFIIELDELKGRKKLSPHNVFSILHY